MMNLSQMSEVQEGVFVDHRQKSHMTLMFSRLTVTLFDQRPGRSDSAWFYAPCSIIDGCVPIKVRKAVTISPSCQRSPPRFPLCAAARFVCKTNSR